MKYTEFQNLNEQTPKNPKVGDVFLEGTKAVDQKVMKNIGEMIVYFVITNVLPNGNIEYKQVFDKLVED